MRRNYETGCINARLLLLLYCLWYLQCYFSFTKMKYFRLKMAATAKIKAWVRVKEAGSWRQLWLNVGLMKHPNHQCDDFLFWNEQRGDHSREQRTFTLQTWSRCWWRHRRLHQNRLKCKEWKSRTCMLTWSSFIIKSYLVSKYRIWTKPHTKYLTSQENKLEGSQCGKISKSSNL